MSQALPEPSPRPARPWSNRTSLGTDLAAAFLLLMIEIAVSLGKAFADGMDVWAAEGDRRVVDASDLAGITWLGHLLVVTLIITVIAALSRAPWTAVLQLLTAGMVVVLLALAQHGYDQRHPSPPPAPNPNYTPCYSGSGRCY
ncbi:DUF6234 family protein [Streptomyces sp. NPDC052000]|uniref:DUF6234 family protein n=1 Tax=Streptomyces sp. NPDC052000 TaxID=3155676 RepID=UPI00344E4273